MFGRTLWVTGGINGSLSYFVKQILRWNREDVGIPIEDRTPIKIIINSEGGEVQPMLQMCDVMLTSTTPIYTVAANWVMSSAMFIFLCGHKRFIFKRSTGMIHPVSGGASGTQQQVVDNTAFMTKIQKMLDEMILERTSIPKQTLTRKNKSDWYIYADEMIQYGIAHKIIESLDEVI